MSHSWKKNMQQSHNPSLSVCLRQDWSSVSNSPDLPGTSSWLRSVGLEPPGLLRWSEQPGPASGVPSVVGCTVLGTQLASNTTVPSTLFLLLTIPSIFSFICLPPPAFYTRDRRLPGAVPTPRAAADSALRSGGCSLKLVASLQAWLSAPGMLLRQAGPHRGHASVGLVVVPIWPSSLCLLSAGPHWYS